MSNGQLSPAQLDQLEDALEDLELRELDGIEDEDVHARLSSYQEILRLSRDVMPLEDVPVGLLDGVLAEARESSPVPVLEPAAIEPVTPWWQSWRTWFIPGVAVVATAALVLVIVVPRDEEPPVVATAEELKPSLSASNGANPVAPVDSAKWPMPGAAEARDRALDLAAASPEPEPDATPLGGVSRTVATEQPAVEAKREESSSASLSEEEADMESPAEYAAKDVDGYGDKAAASKKGSSFGYEPPPPAKPKRSRSVVQKQSSTGSEGQGAGGPRPSAPPTPESIEDAIFDGAKALAQGDRWRAQDDCGAARSYYRQAEEDENATIRARALAGLGLCSLMAGDEIQAERYFSRAESTDAKVRSYIRGERKRIEATRVQSKAKAKPVSKKSADANVAPNADDVE